MWSFLTFILQLLLFLEPRIVSCHGLDEITSTLLSDATLGLFFPASGLGTMVCADADDLVQMSKILTEKGVASVRLDPWSFHNDARRFSIHQTVFLLDYDCPWAELVIQKANDSQMLRAPFKWMILQDLRDAPDSCNENCLRKTFETYAMYPDSNVVLLRRFSDEFFEINSVYRPSPVRDMIVEERGYWNKSDGIRLRNDHVPSRRRGNLQKTPLRSSLVVMNPDTLNHLTDYQDKHVDTIVKCNYAWLHNLVDAMNATVTHGVVSSWGYRDKNGSWTGLMGEYSNKRIDIGGTCMFLTPERMEYVDYLPLSTPSSLGFIFREPPLSFVSNLFILPFQSSVWYAVGLLLFFIVVILATSAHWEYSTRINDSPPFTFADSLTLVIGAVAWQGFEFRPKSMPTRIILIMLLMAAVALCAAYSANIVALLQATTKSIRTLKDLLDSPIKCGAHDIIYSRHYFKVENDPIRRAIIDEKIEPKSGKSNWMTAEEGIEKVRQGFFAFFMEARPGYRILEDTFEEDEKCGIREMYFIIHTFPTFSIAKHSPYQEILRVNAVKIIERGLQSREMLKWYAKRPPCNGLSKFVSVGLRECYFAFYIMGYGVLISLLIYIVEMIWMTSCTIKRKNNGKIDFDEDIDE